MHNVNLAGYAGVKLTKRTASVRFVNATRENLFVLTKCTAKGCFSFH